MQSPQLCSWVENLIWCPSQCFYYFKDNENKKWCIYLRWRHCNPWTAELCPLDDNWDIQSFTPLDLDREYIDSEYKDLEIEALKKVKELFPLTIFIDR